MRIARVLPMTKAEGPGTRFCLWVQGCHIRCPGCFAEDLQDPLGGYEASTDEILAELHKVQDKIEGITILGGEPMEQAAELSIVAKAAKKKGLGVITFTGHVYDDILRKNDMAQTELIKYTDVLLSGPYIEAEKDFSRPLVGSKNQEIHFLTDRYSKEIFSAYKNGVEVRIAPDGVVIVNGMGEFIEGIKQKGV